MHAFCPGDAITYENHNILCTNDQINFVHSQFNPVLFFPQRADEPQCVARSWSTQQVCDWLKSLNMEQYVSEFRDKDVDGELLLQMDGTKLKVL